MVFWDITFPCFWAGFARIPLTFLSSLLAVFRYSETLKGFAQYRRHHESGASARSVSFQSM